MIDRGWEPYTITFLYGQKHRREIEAAASLVAQASKSLPPQIVIEIPAISVLVDNSALIQDSNVKIPNLSRPDQRTLEVLQSTVVPFRNGVFLSLASCYAQKIGAKAIFYGAHFSDYAVYPDCRPEFVHAMERAIQEGTDSKAVHLHAPFLPMPKSKIVELGHKLKVPFDLTWSCYKGGDIHCGTCPSCIERKVAFKDAHVKDPTEYAKH